MDIEAVNAVDLSAEAVLELHEVRAGKRNDAPSLHRLFEALRAPQPSFDGSGISMLADVRSHSLFRDIGPQQRRTKNNRQELVQAIDKYLTELERGVSSKLEDKISEARSLCLLLSDRLLERDIEAVYSRRERDNSRYIADESVS